VNVFLHVEKWYKVKKIIK